MVLIDSKLLQQCTINVTVNTAFSIINAKAEKAYRDSVSDGHSDAFANNAANKVVEREMKELRKFTKKQERDKNVKR